ncbi:interferon-induced protein 44-like isoform X2 [Ctenopharyngodon idella]|uniref:interferon-induced protein 44-like isoform X2 n=1 Tax=Ctenopharyngodon idella TaxID=7959 RepID=UPI00222FB32E|nr:interferon-induced protein 44-like isoform X2 [Ctenopharyngodon idella]XP_051744048.1 interferon-induced protein 44-like isoform X2 [Ctenopharyngodon idella]
MGGSESKPIQQEVHQPKPNPELDEPWRKFDWGQKEALKEKLENFSLSDPDVNHIKILVAGQVGAGKSSFINSIDSVFQGRICSRALVNTAAGDSRSFTQKLKGFPIRSGRKSLPFVFKDIMGLEAAALAGSQTDDIINAVFGHVKDGYKFNQEQALTYKDQHYTSDPTLSDQAFCLVYVIAADTVQLTDDKLIDKLKIIRKRINDQGIPQVIIMTKVDEACPLVNKDLRKIYTSKKIKEKMELCSTKVGVPLSNIFPVKNYHEEIDTEDDIDVLILKALEQIVQIADDRLLDREIY